MSQRWALEGRIGHSQNTSINNRLKSEEIAVGNRVFCAKSVEKEARALTCHPERARHGARAEGSRESYPSKDASGNSFPRLSGQQTRLFVKQPKGENALSPHGRLQLDRGSSTRAYALAQNDRLIFRVRVQPPLL